MNLDCQLFLHTIILITMASGDLSRVPEVKDMAISNTQFTLDLIRQCGADLKGQNVFLAPYSITTALAMTYMGAQGDTAAEMRKVLKWSSAEAPTKGFGSYLTLLQEASSGETPGYILVGAQRIYIDGKLSLKPEFSSAVQQHFASDAKAADFVGNPDGERVNINSWVMDQTRGKIRDLLPSGSIDSLTAMVLVQATYFKGNWMHKFDAKDTKPADFFTPQGKVTVNMMQQRRNFNYGASPELKCTAVELPYASNSANARRHDLSMLILLPDARDGLDEMEVNLTHDSLEKIRSSLSSQKVDLKLPRFSMESSFALKKVLSNLGMPLAFSAQADFSGMATVDGVHTLYISEVFHKAVVDVNEEGSEAAAATAVTIAKRSLPIIHPFIADHPFVFIIIDKRAEVILFSGHVTNPPSVSESQSKDEL